MKTYQFWRQSLRLSLKLRSEPLGKVSSRPNIKMFWICYSSPVLWASALAVISVDKFIIYSYQQQ